MHQTPTAHVTTGRLRLADGWLHYELRGHGPLVALVGSPMDAAAFAPVADLLAVGYTVLTADPRGINRSRLDDQDKDSTPQLRADDLAELLVYLDAGPAVAFGSSGGASTVLALVQSRPELLSAVIAHEPPVVGLLADSAQILAQTEDIIATYLAGDVIGAWRKFMVQADIDMPDAALQAMVGGERDAQPIADERRWFEHELRATDRWLPDLAALRAAAPRIVIGVGAESKGQLCARTSDALAAELGVEPVAFPGGHIGFVEDPAAFATRLREVAGR